MEFTTIEQAAVAAVAQAQPPQQPPVVVQALEQEAPEPQPTVAVIGLVIALEAIQGADRIQLATVSCGDAGMWKGVVTLEISDGDKVLVLLQDALLPPDNERWAFMSKHKFRVRMARFKRVPSECVILPAVGEELDEEVGSDVGAALGVTKYSKPIPAEMAGKAKGNFPSFVPKTDEPNFQRCREREDIMREAWEATLKYDGTSGTSFVREDVLRVCSRKLELEPGTGVYWQMAEKYQLQRVPEGLALQFEIVGPDIQGNPLGLAEPEIRAFTLYDIVNQCKAPRSHLAGICTQLGLPIAKLVASGYGPRSDEDLRLMAEAAAYDNGSPAEGIVIRDVDGRGSMKVISLLYKD